MMTITPAEYRKLSEAIGAAFDSDASLSDVLRTVAIKHALKSQVTDADVLWSVQLIEWWAGDEVTKMKQDEHFNKNEGK